MAENTAPSAAGRRLWRHNTREILTEVMSMIHADSKVVEAVLSAIPEPFFVFDEDGHYVEILGGIDRSRYHDGLHLIGKRIHEVIRAELADQYLAQIRKAILHNQVLTYNYTLSARDIKGSEDLAGPEGLQWFEAHISPIATIEGQPRMVVWMASTSPRCRRP